MPDWRQPVVQFHKDYGRVSAVVTNEIVPGDPPLTEETELETFRRMARDFPVRTLVYTFCVPLLGLLQVVNAVVFEGSLPVVIAFAILTSLCSFVLTRYHVAMYRRQQVERHVAARG